MPEKLAAIGDSSKFVTAMKEIQERRKKEEILEALEAAGLPLPKPGGKVHYGDETYTFELKDLPKFKMQVGEPELERGGRKKKREILEALEAAGLPLPKPGGKVHYGEDVYEFGPEDLPGRFKMEVGEPELHSEPEDRPMVPLAMMRAPAGGVPTTIVRPVKLNLKY